MRAIMAKKKKIVEKREVTRLEAQLGTETYRMLKGLVTNPVSVIGLVLLGIFLLIAAAAPILAPPQREGADPYRIPRDGYGSIPRPPGSEWKTRQPPIPFWWKTVTGHEQWV
ncbi:MAG: hypothetical protein DRI37_02000, partial [Chloroflexi bacterium]